METLIISLETKSAIHSHFHSSERSLFFCCDNLTTVSSGIVADYWMKMHACVMCSWCGELSLSSVFLKAVSTSDVAKMSRTQPSNDVIMRSAVNVLQVQTFRCCTIVVPDIFH